MSGRGLYVRKCCPVCQASGGRCWRCGGAGWIPVYGKPAEPAISDYERREMEYALGAYLNRANRSDHETYTREAEAGGRAYLDGPYVEHCDDDF